MISLGETEAGSAGTAPKGGISLTESTLSTIQAEPTQSPHLVVVPVKQQPQSMRLAQFLARAR